MKLLNKILKKEKQVKVEKKDSCCSFDLEKEILKAKEKEKKKGKDSCCN